VEGGGKEPTNGKKRSRTKKITITVVLELEGGGTRMVGGERKRKEKSKNFNTPEGKVRKLSDLKSMLQDRRL